MTQTPTNEDLQHQIAENFAATSALLKAAATEAAARAKAADERMTRFEQGLAQTRALVDKNAKSLDKLHKADGNAGRRRGFAFERALFHTLLQTKKLGGIRLTNVLFSTTHSKKGYEYDLVGINGKYTLPIEAKKSLSVKDVKHFAEKRLPFFAKLHPQHSEGKEILGVLVYERTDVDGEAVDEAVKRGLLVFCADGHQALTRMKSRDDVKEHYPPPQKLPRKTAKANGKSTPNPRQQK